MSLRTRLLLSHGLVSLVGLLVLFAAVALLVTESQARQIQRQLSLIALTATRTTPRNLQTEQNLPRLLERLRRFGEDEKVRVFLLDANGKVLEDVNATGISLSTSFKNRTVGLSKKLNVTASLQGIAAVGEFRDAGRRWLYAAVPTRDGVEVAEWFAIAQPVAGRFAFALLDDLALPLLQGLLAALAVSLLAAVWVARSVATPIHHVARAADAIAQGKYDQRVVVNETGVSEVRSLANDFNHMAVRVQAAQQAERDLVSNVSHELRTPLTSIQGFAQAIEDGTAGTPSAVQHAAKVIREEAERLKRLTDSLLESSKLQSGSLVMAFAPLQLNDIAERCAERFQPVAKEAGVNLQINLAALPLIKGDADRLAQVMTNLLDNALKHTSSGGRVSIQTKPVLNGVELSVSDTGAGIPPEDVPRIFERFYQVDKSRASGLGLGLAISKQIVEAHGGTLQVQSVLGLGTRFTVVILVGT